MPFLVPERMGSQKLQFFLGLPCKNLPKVTSKQQGQKKILFNNKRKQKPNSTGKVEAEKGSSDKSSHPSYSRGLNEASNKKKCPWPFQPHSGIFMDLSTSEIWSTCWSESQQPAALWPCDIGGSHWADVAGCSAWEEKNGAGLEVQREFGVFLGFGFFLLVCFRFSQYFWVTRGTVSPPPNSNTNKLATSWNISLEPKPMCAPIPRGSGGPHGNYVPHRLKMWSCQRAF